MSRFTRRGRKYTLLLAGAALVAAVLPGDAITMLLETVPLYLLFEVGVLFASFVERRQRARDSREARAAGAADSIA